MNHNTTACPLVVLSQRMSVLPSPLKSPVPATIVADVMRFSYAIKTDEVFDTHNRKVVAGTVIRPVASLSADFEIIEQAKGQPPPALGTVTPPAHELN